MRFFYSLETFGIRNILSAVFATAFDFAVKSLLVDCNDRFAAVFLFGLRSRHYEISQFVQTVVVYFFRYVAVAPPVTFQLSYQVGTGFENVQSVVF